MLQHPVEFPTLRYSLNATTQYNLSLNATTHCRITHCVLLTEYYHSSPSAGYRKKEHLTAHIVAKVHFDARDGHVILDVLFLQVDSVR
jgi:hypothetical protein